uniref:Uncharacterized protein n=1 Tax=Arundo donax TaxID=35708 RepID=A0A0A9FF68_ARUDO
MSLYTKYSMSIQEVSAPLTSLVQKLHSLHSS